VHFGKNILAKNSTLQKEQPQTKTALDNGGRKKRLRLRRSWRQALSFSTGFIINYYSQNNSNINV